MEKKLHIVCTHPDSFDNHRYRGCRDKMFLLYQVNSRDHVFKRLCDLMDLIKGSKDQRTT